MQSTLHVGQRLPQVFSEMFGEVDELASHVIHMRQVSKPALKAGLLPTFIVARIVVDRTSSETTRFRMPKMTKSHPMTATKDVVIFKLPMHINPQIAIIDSVKKWLDHRRRLLSAYAPSGDNSAVVITVRRNYSASVEHILGVRKVWLISLLDWIGDNVAQNAFRWRSSTVVEHHYNFPYFVEARASSNIFNSYPSSLIRSHCGLSSPDAILGSNSSIFRGFSGIVQFGILPTDLSELTAHDVKLAVIDNQGDYSNDSQNGVYDKLSTFDPSKLPRKFSGGSFLIVGMVVGILSNFALWWSGWRHWRLVRRLSLGIGGWAIAVVLVCHGAGLLLGIN
jgi:hypothetical protein